VFFVPGVRSNRDPDAGAEFLDQLTQELRVAAVKPLDIDWISDRSIPSSVGRVGFDGAAFSCRPLVVAGAHRP
jgi:hypothetical protein